MPADVISTGCKIKVANPYDPANYAESDNPFGIRGDVTLTSPTLGTESWDVGSIHPITWTYVGPIPNMKIQYSTTGINGTFTTLPGATRVANTGSWNWTIDNSTVLTTAGRIKISDSDNFTTQTVDYSDNNFTVKGALRVDAPNSNVTLRVGDPSYPINWTNSANTWKDTM